MFNKTWNKFNSGLSWSTKIYVMVAILITIGAFIFNAWTTNWALTMLFTMAGTLLTEYFLVFSRRHPKTWTTIKWLVLFFIIMLLFWSVL